MNVDEAIALTPTVERAQKAIVEFAGVSKAFGPITVLRDVDLALWEGEVTVICGPSGSGKSTLLRCINGLERVQSGRITVMGQTLSDQVLRSAAFRAEIGFVFQKFSLYPHMTVMQNLTLAPCRVRGVAAEAAKAQARELLARVGLAEKADVHPAQLSGGQQQRVAIIRALAMRPKIMLFDEPTSALDPEMIREVLDVIRDLARTGMTMIIVTHEMGFAREIANRVVFMEGGEIVTAATTARFFEHNSSERTQRFLDRVLRH